MYQPTEVTFTDPRSFDGNPYDVAERAIAQCAGILKVYDQALEGAWLMTRNAEMERNLATQKPPAGDEFLDTPQGRQFVKLSELLKESNRILGVLQVAAAYDPKHPPRV